MNFWYPAAFAINTYAITGLLIFCGLTGRITLAADLGISQAATLALFFGFSANIRNLILRSPTGALVRSALVSRLYLLLPLSLVSYYLCASLASAGPLIAAAVILRRCCDWLSEVQLSAGEIADDRPLAKSYVRQQGALLALLLLVIILKPGAAPWPLLAWALSPLSFNYRFIARTLASAPAGSFPWSEISPNFGSTAIIGIAAYIFRLVILLLTGKETAGDLYTAFALGGLISSLYMGVFGPTMVLGEQRGLKHELSRWLTAAAWCQLAAGAGLFAVYAAGLTAFEATGKSMLFAGAAGASMMGGVIMLQAQKVRLRLLQSEGVNDLFGPDVLMNVAIIGSALFGFQAVGQRTFIYIYMWNSVLALLFYLSAKAEIRRETAAPPGAAPGMKWWGLAIAASLAAPVFFQLGHGLFIDPLRSPYFDTLGVFRDLPLPLSVAGCFAGLIVFGAYRGVLSSLLTIFSMFSLMFISTIFSADGNISGSMSKILLMVQFTLPFFGLVVGQSVSRVYGDSKLFLKIFLATIFSVSSLQLFFTFYEHSGRLTPYLYAFSIYQHLQYVPVIFAAIYVVGLFSLFKERRFRYILVFMSALMPVYSILAVSMTALGLSVLGLLVFFFLSNKFAPTARLAMAVLTLAVVAGTFHAFRNSPPMRQKFTFLDPSFSSMSIRRKLPNIDERLRYWKVYSKAIVSGSEIFLWGHNSPPSRTEFPSAHNYFLDFVYNFGLIPFLPFLALLLYTLRNIWRRRAELPADMGLLGLVMVVLFLIFVDNSVKVGMRQPYPGILTFFLWGSLLSRLKVSGPEVPAAPEPGDEKPFRVAVLNLTASGISGGYKKYLVRLLPLLEEKLEGGKVLCASPPGVPVKDWVGPLDRTEFIECKPFFPFPGGRDTALAAKLKEFSPDLVFVPLERYFSYPGVPFVSMLVNMAPMAKNYSVGSVSEKARQLVQIFHAKRSVRKATHVIVTSKFVRSYLVSGWGIPAKKISVIYPGAERQDGLALAKPAALAEKGWDKFFWTVGSLERYRGLEDILDAMLQPGAEDTKLVVCASVRGQMASYAHDLKALIAGNGLEGRVLWVSGLSEGELAWCYRNSVAYIMTSRIEAGPNTALEAMSFGAVSIAAENPPLPEFFSDTALYYPPGDGKALAARMAEVLAWGKEKRAASSLAAFERSNLFNWEYAAEKTAALFKKLSGRRV